MGTMVLPWLSAVILQQQGQHYIFYCGSDGNGDNLDKHHGNVVVVEKDATVIPW